MTIIPRPFVMASPLAFPALVTARKSSSLWRISHHQENPLSVAVGLGVIGGRRWRVKGVDEERRS